MMTGQFTIYYNCKKTQFKRRRIRSDIYNSRDHFVMSEGPVPFLHCELYKLMIITSVWRQL